MFRSATSCALVLALLVAPGARAQMTTELVASGFTQPTYITAVPGDTERVFVLEQPGLIKIIKNGVVLPEPFLDWTGAVNNGGNEQGLLGMAFDPDFATNGHFYLYYTAGTNAGRSIVRRLTVSANPDSADENSNHKVWFILQTDTNHNGGQIEFGSDGYLYIGLGDGGGAGDQPNNAQNGLTQLGKMIRIDVNGDDYPADPAQNYAIPPTNPFVGNANFLDEIWAYGLRNPYRWSFDRLTGDIWIADVGQNAWEEIDFQPASSTGGENYGWRLMEGNHCYNPPVNCDPGGLTYPIHEYSHSQDGLSCSITGGYVYRGSAIPGVQGHYFYADFCSNQIYTLKYDGTTVTELTNRTSELNPPGEQINAITAFGEDGTGELWIADRGGEIFKIVPDPAAVGVEPVVGKPVSISLGRGVPNPFRASTSFELALDRRAEVSVSVYTAAGRLVRRVHDETAAAGTLSVSWDGRDAAGRRVPSGTYFVRAEADGAVSTRRVTLLH